MDIAIHTIRPMVQQVAEAIAAALKMEVEIADNQLLRIAGTGPFRTGVMQAMSQDGYVYQEVIRSHEPVLIETPGFHDLCRSCKYHLRCPEKAELSCPILVDGAIRGVIGLVAMDDAQRERLLVNQEALLGFLRKMADLIGAKLTELASQRKHLVAVFQLETVINYLDRGLIALDRGGRITQANTVAARLLGTATEELVGSPGTKVIPDLRFPISARHRVHHETTVPVGKQRRHLVVEIAPVWLWNELQGAVITIEDEAEMSRRVSRVANRAPRTGVDDILGASPAIAQVKAMIRRVAVSDSTVMVRGETGTGKELCARAVHAASRRADGPFVAVNCGAIPETLLESELFGYEDGAFTGARQGGKIGRFQLADGGTLFLDEVADLPLHLQVKLLRGLQERQVERVGSTRAVPVDVRIIAATNRSLEAMLQDGAFREDLFYRLNVIPIQMPSLRERAEDILPLADYFLRLYGEKLDKPLAGFRPEAVPLLVQYPWPGNVRELANAVEYAVNMEDGAAIAPGSLPQRIRQRGVAPPPPPQPIQPLKELERAALLQAVEYCRQTQAPLEQAAALLGIGRTTLFRKLKEYQLKP